MRSSVIFSAFANTSFQRYEKMFMIYKVLREGKTVYIRDPIFLFKINRATKICKTINWYLKTCYYRVIDL